MNNPPAFADLPLIDALRVGLDALGHTRMTPIQARAVPPALDGLDVIAQAPTGSGKTVAFGLALLHRIDIDATRVQALVLCPTRELADQVAKQLRRLATGLANMKLLTLTGGVALAPQLASLEHPPHIVVGTPGRVQELLGKKALDLRQARMLVLDEADRMLDMGFEDAIREIVRAMPASRQTLLFSATYPDSIRAIARAAMREPVEVTVDEALHAAPIEQRLYDVEPADKPAALEHELILASRELSEKLGLKADYLHCFAPLPHSLMFDAELVIDYPGYVAQTEKAHREALTSLCSHYSLPQANTLAS